MALTLKQKTDQVIKPEYYGDEADGFPTQSDVNTGAILYHADTGKRYELFGSDYYGEGSGWILTHWRGLAVGSFADSRLYAPMGLYKGGTSGAYNQIYGVNKFGRSINADSGVPTDIWDRANVTNDQPIWVAPTTLRLHNIASTSALDDGNPVGTGARTIKIYGTSVWTGIGAPREVSETITMNGTTDVATVNYYVVIHRMKVLTWGSAGPNVGTITATAQTDASVTAQIDPGEGQTQMAIFSINAKQDFYMTKFYSSVNKSVASVAADIKLLVNENCDNELTGFLTKHTNGLNTAGTSQFSHSFDPYYKVTGPAIIKIQTETNANNSTIDAGFDGYIVDDIGA